jgi:hypothetical protein
MRRPNPAKHCPAGALDILIIPMVEPLGSELRADSFEIEAFWLRSSRRSGRFCAWRTRRGAASAPHVRGQRVPVGYPEALLGEGNGEAFNWHGTAILVRANVSLQSHHWLPRSGLGITVAAIPHLLLSVGEHCGVTSKALNSPQPGSLLGAARFIGEPVIGFTEIFFKLSVERLELGKLHIKDESQASEPVGLGALQGEEEVRHAEAIACTEAVLCFGVVGKDEEEIVDKARRRFVDHLAKDAAALGLHGSEVSFEGAEAEAFAAFALAESLPCLAQ